MITKAKLVLNTEEINHLIIQSIQQELLWSETEVAQFLDKVSREYNITSTELTELFKQAGYVYIDQPITKLDNIFIDKYINIQALTEIKNYITQEENGKHPYLWHFNDFKATITKELDFSIEALKLEHQHLIWTMENEYTKVLENIDQQISELNKRKQFLDPLYYKNDKKLIDIWTDLVKQGNIC